MISKSIYAHRAQSMRPASSWSRAACTLLLSCYLLYFCFPIVVSKISVLTGCSDPHSRQGDGGSNTALELNPDDTPWSRIVPASRLVYHTCYNGLQCARLLVPMDWHNATRVDATVAIAIVRIPAKVGVADPRYGGAIIVNPGGPGGSGVDFTVGQGSQLQSTVDAFEELNATYGSSTDSKYFDIIGFDPRGVRHSSPRIECFPSSFSRLIWTLQNAAEGIVGGPVTTLDARWARHESFSKACMQRISPNDEQNIAYHINTTPVMRDVVEISERHGEWRESQAREWLASPAGTRATRHRPSSHPLSAQTVLQRTKWHMDMEMLQYWGTSYGTFIGQYLATAYPERIHRAVFDSTHLVNDVHAGSSPTDIEDADKVFASFCIYCHHVGPAKCPIDRHTAPEISSAIEEIFARLYEQPLAVPASEQRGPSLITYSDLKRAFGRAIYDPLGDFPRFARFFQDLSQGNGTSFANWKADSQHLNFADAARWSVSDKCLEEGPFSVSCQSLSEFQEEVGAAVLCTDSEGASDLDKAEFKQRWATMKNTSTVLGDIWAESLLACVGWTVRAKWRLAGPFTSQTKNPILLVNNRLDPVTPLRDAMVVSGNFPGSAVLIQNTVGHMTQSAKSNCTAAYVRSYFQAGVLPPNGTVCEVDEHPFGALAWLDIT